MSLIHQAPTSNLNNVRKNLKIPAPKLLIAVPSPRKIKQFKEKLDILNTKYDVFIVKNDFIEVNAYKSIRDFFLQHIEYTHLAILPDDLLVDMRHVDKLVDDLKQYDYAVLSGICNFACTNRRMFEKMGAIEYGKVDALQRMISTGRFDYQGDIMTRQRYNEIKKQMEKKTNRIIRVSHSAFPLTIIRRDVVEKIEFGTNLMGVDTHFFQQVNTLGITAYADLDVETFHLKGIEQNRDMKKLLTTGFNENIDTRVVYTKSNPPQRDEIFLPAVQQITK